MDGCLNNILLFLQSSSVFRLTGAWGHALCEMDMVDFTFGFIRVCLGFSHV